MIRAEADAWALPYEERLAAAFGDGTEERQYLGGGQDLGVQVLTFSDVPHRDLAQVLAAALHSVIIVLVGPGLLLTPLPNWLQPPSSPSSDKASHAILCAGTEGARRKLYERADGLRALQGISLEAMGEPQERPALLAMRVMRAARHLLSDALPAQLANDYRFSQGFLSHAKQDGLPLTQAIRRLIEDHPWMRRGGDGAFYDQDAIPDGRDFRVELERGVRQSTFVALRTAKYAARPFCKQEIAWAERYAVPMVVVEARRGPLEPADQLPVANAPAVYVTDVNLLRVLYAIERETLRALLFMRKVAELQATERLPRLFHALPTRPSPAAILHACQTLPPRRESDAKPVIIYPDPALDGSALAVAEAILEVHAPDARLTTPYGVLAET